MASIRSLQFSGSDDSPSTLSAAATALSFFSATPASATFALRGLFRTALDVGASLPIVSTEAGLFSTIVTLPSVVTFARPRRLPTSPCKRWALLM